MTSPNEPDDDVEDAALERALDGAHAAAGDDAGRRERDRTPSVLAEISNLIGDPTAGEIPVIALRDADPAGDTPMLKPLGPDDARAAGKYVIQGLLGRGGVGTVHRGHDQDLGRDVAMKFLLTKFKDQPAVLQRFVEEAQIGGQLQHPGIVPVYELGMSQGRPFFTMKLVKGRTLAQRLAERDSPATDRRAFVSIFEDVCQTMAYAHARGVVHRDLKPANVMIGSFGEVQVVDWGMGKVLAPGAGEPRATALPSQLDAIETVRSSGEGIGSIDGTVMGTPAYIPPEQARGETDRIDERSDVFALGAILCEILTGQPPYVGVDQNELLTMAAMARLDGARERLRTCGADPELVELAERCLMPAPAARPRSAETVAKAAHDHLAAAEASVHEARVRAAEADARATALRRTQRLGVALTVVIGIGLAASSWFWLDAARAQSKAATARSAAESNLANFDRLSYVLRLETARAKANTLYPAWPEKAADMRAWLNDDAEVLRGALPDLAATLAVLEARALPPTGAEQEPGPVGSPRDERFADAADQFLYGILRELTAECGSFVEHEIADVEQRLAWAGRVEELTITRHRERWEEARHAILRADGVTASELYAEVPLELAPQLGLVPIGANPKTLLWEFCHLRSGWDPATDIDPATLAIPTYGADGNLDVTGCGVVFVLIPGGKFLMGAQRHDEDAPNFDPFAAPNNEGPVTEVELAPYLLSKYELTQGQWARLSGGEYPSRYELGRKYDGIPVPIGDTHPVEQVSWTACDGLLRQHGLVLPTEAQWERGCRAGTSTPWFTGDTPASLDGFANVLDQTGRNVPPQWTGVGAEEFDDGFKGPAPVGTFDSNGFGLFDVYGNVLEWCRDWRGPYTLPTNPGDGLRDPGPSRGDRVYRGGAYQYPARASRSADRYRRPPAYRSPNLGVRAAMEIR